MPAADLIKIGLINYLRRALERDDDLTEGQVRALEIYCENFHSPQERQRRVEKYLEEETEREEKTGFDSPKSGLLDANQVAQYMGFTFKNSAAVVRRMGRDGRLPKPVPRVRGKKDFWKETELREHCERLSA